MINSLKYTQSSICLAWGKTVRSQFKVFDNNFISLGYKFLGGTLIVSTASLQRLRANINRLYEQQERNARLGRNLEKWPRRAIGGVNNLISSINFNINPNPSTRMR